MVRESRKYSWFSVEYKRPTQFVSLSSKPSKKLAQSRVFRKSGVASNGELDGRMAGSDENRWLGRLADWEDSRWLRNVQMLPSSLYLELTSSIYSLYTSHEDQNHPRHQDGSGFLTTLWMA